jgi:hypothetical protein
MTAAPVTFTVITATAGTVTWTPDPRIQAIIATTPGVTPKLVEETVSAPLKSIVRLLTGALLSSRLEQVLHHVDVALAQAARASQASLS